MDENNKPKLANIISEEFLDILKRDPEGNYGVIVYPRVVPNDREGLERELGYLGDYCKQNEIRNYQSIVGLKTASFIVPRMKGKHILEIPSRGYTIEKGKLD